MNDLNKVISCENFTPSPYEREINIIGSPAYIREDIVCWNGQLVNSFMIIYRGKEFQMLSSKKDLDDDVIRRAVIDYIYDNDIRFT
jgi:hypothetical protein